MQFKRQPARRALARWLKLSVVLSGLLALTVLSCRQPEPTSPTVVHGAASAPCNGLHEQSVKSGINDSYKNPDVEEWIERFERESRELFRYRHRIVEAVGLRPGMVVADVGAGTGFFTLLFSKEVGPNGKVIAVDIVPEFLELVRKRAREDGLRNVQSVLCEEDSVTLPPVSVDLAFLCDTYHHFEYPRSTMRSIHRTLKPGGELVVVDFMRIPKKSREWILNHVRAGQEVVTAEIVAAGFTLVDDAPLTPFLDENYLIRFRKEEAQTE